MVMKAFTREVSLCDNLAYEGAGLGRADEVVRQAVAEVLERDRWMREHGLIKPRMTPQQHDRELRLRRVLRGWKATRCGAFWRRVMVESISPTRPELRVLAQFVGAGAA